MATYFAQAAGAIQTIEWNDAPGGGGNVLTWGNLDPADVLCANGKAITWAAASVPTLTCARLSTADEDAGGAGVAGGGFALSGSTAVAITADITAGTTACLTSTHTGTGVNAVTVTGNVTGGSVANAYGARNNGAGAITITGAVTGGSAVGANGAWNSGTGAVTINGNVTGGSATGANGVYNNGAGAITITGAVTGGSGAGGAYGAWNGGTGTINIYTGPVTGGSAVGAYNQSAGTININGTVAASSTARAFGVCNNSTGVITVIGSLVDTELCGAYYGPLFWQPVAGVHYHKVFRSAGFAEYYTGPPLDEDVRQGVQAGFQSDGSPYVGVFVVPSEADVKLGVGYGAGGTEFEGDLVAGGGGVPLIGPGGLVG